MRHRVISVVVVVQVRLYRDAVVRSLREQPNMQLQGEADSARQALIEVARVRPDVLLLDLGVAGALEALRLVRESAPDVRVIALGFGGSDEEAVAGAEAGLSGYVSAHQPLDDVLAAIRDVMRGEAPCDGRIAAALLRRVASTGSGNGGSGGNGRVAGTPLENLTSREQGILELMARGLSNKEIASELVIGVATVKSHVHAILRKLGVSRRGAAAQVFRDYQNVAHRSLLG